MKPLPHIFRQAVRFVAVGGVLTLLSYAVFMSVLALGFHYTLAAVCGWAAGVVISYFLNKSFTFSLGGKLVWREFAGLVAGYIIQLALALAGYALLIDGLGFGLTPAFVVNTLFLTAFNFLFMRYAVFRGPRPG